MRIGIDIRLIGKQRTGDEAVFFNLTKNIAGIETENEYFLFTDEMKEERLEEISKKLELGNKNNFKIVPLKSKNKFCWNFWDLPRALVKNPVDLYLTQYITPFFVPRKTKMITIIHDISFNFFPQFIKKSDLFFLKALIPLSIKRADKVLGVSQFTRDEIVRYYGVPKEKVDFFHNAVPEGFQKDFSEEELGAVRKKYGLPSKFVLYLGTFQPRKNIPFLIESYAEIKDRILGTKLVLVGNKKSRNFDKRIDDSIRRFELEEGAVFTGFVDEQDKAAIYKMARAFAFPSLYEGFGIPLLESFSAGTPVLASDIPSLREVAEGAALFANPRDIEKFSKALYDICVDENLRNGLIVSGYDRADFFSWEKTAKKVVGIFNTFNYKK